MAQNFLYMFEFVVDDLLITRPNMCAPEEYPTCCELTFRSHVFVAICDKEFGGCIDTARKSGKCCLFSLEKEINRNDRLQLHVYKKRTDQCKFLIGATEIPVNRMFDKVTEDFYARNPNWDAHLKNNKGNARAASISKKSKVVIDNDCGAADPTGSRKEKLCPTYELSKKLLALSNMSGTLQTGNIVLIMRLSCMGPTIVSPFMFEKQNPCCPKMKAPCEKEEVNDAMICRRYFGKNSEKGCPCDECVDDKARCAQANRKRKEENECGSSSQALRRSCPCPCSCPDCCDACGSSNRKKKEANSCCPKKVKPCCPCPCSCSDCCDQCEVQKPRKKKEKKTYYCAPEPKPRGCPCPECDEECEMEEESQEDECGEEEEDIDDEDEEDAENGNSDIAMKSCFVRPTAPDCGPEKYDEFEANLNGSGLTIRVLKDTHMVENVNDVDEPNYKCPSKKGRPETCEDTIKNLLQTYNFAKHQIERKTGGNIVNSKCLPVVRGNIKYSENECCGDSLNVPLFNKLPPQKGVDSYRKTPEQIRNCCLQVYPRDIDSTLRGFNAEAKKKGIEVCHRTIDDPDTDVFLVKLGNKKSCHNKKNIIEIELRTPKEPEFCRAQKWTKETQVDEAILDAHCSNKKGKKCSKKKKRKHF